MEFDALAVQKLDDLASYIELLGHQEYDRSFKKQAKEMALDLFTDRDVLVSLSGTKKPVHKYLGQVLKGKVENGITFSYLRPVAVFSQSTTGGYAGTVVFNTNTGNRTRTHSATLVIKQVEQHFGGDTEKTWRLFIGEITFVTDSIR